ncbi:MAG: hypothetical protein M3680_04605 [Myxococcota bacterium]|nr:hypothetical protein [Myxococcota bacterium]
MLRDVLCSIAIVATMITSESSAEAWWFREHEAIGKESYVAACKQIEEDLDLGEIPKDAAQRVRFRIACGNLEVVTQLYGQATALAADHVVEPKAFLSASGGWQAVNFWTYIRLAIVNADHFHPLAPRTWSRHHLRAKQLALEGSRLAGMAQIEAFERAMFEHAFADHMLHDAFASGHMGFNRPATSAAAGYVFHDIWSSRGRTISDRKGRTWKTYGDGLLDAPKNAAGREHLLAAATLSITGLVRTFVEGVLRSHEELEIWESFPFLIEAPEILSAADALFAGEESGKQAKLEPLSAVNWAARKDRVYDLWMIGIGGFERLERPFLALLGGRDVSLPFTSTQTYLALGISLPSDLERPRFAAQLGFTRTLGLTNDGLVSHQANLGFIWDARRSEFAGAAHLTYQMTLELAQDLIRIQVGPSFDVRELRPGLFVALGYGRVATAVGGGVR